MISGSAKIETNLKRDAHKSFYVLAMPRNFICGVMKGGDDEK